MESSVGIIDLVIVFALFGAYYFLPISRIKDTATVMMSYGRNGEEWQRRMLKQYWKLPLSIIATAVITSWALNYMGINQGLRELLGFLLGCIFIYLLFWPVITCYRANKAYYELEEWYQANLERRIAAGYGSPGDVYGYIQGVKKREFNRGFAAGQSSEWNNH